MEIKKLFPFVRRHRKWLVIGVLLTFLGVSAAMVPPYLVRRVVDDVIRVSATDGDFTRWRLLASLLAGMAAATIVRAGSIFGKNVLLESLSQRVLRDLKQAVYDHIQGLSFHFFHSTKTGELMARLTNDMEMVRTFLVTGVMHGATGVFYVVISAVILFTVNWQLALVSVAAAPFLLLTTIRFRRAVYPRFQAIRTQHSALNSAVHENVSGIRVVKAFMRYAYEREKFSTQNKALTKRRNEAVQVWAAFMPLVEFLSGISAAFMLVAGGWMVIAGRISIGVWVQFNGYLWMIVMPMRMLGEVVNNYSLASASAERIFEILETRPLITDVRDPVTPPSITGHVQFRNVSWSAGGRRILRNISFSAPAGSTIAIMGATGSGKSSLVHLIPRFYDVDEGAILVDGVDVRSLSLRLLRENVGLVAQETFLFSETMYNNITYGRRGAPPEFVQRVASQTQAHMFIRSMTDGYDTVVGERGIGLSGGQRQRTSIARTLLKEAPILILDDATSAVDMETEALIQRALRNATHLVTTFIVAHRISSVRHADEILILEDGEIVERGTHQALLSADGEYAAIHRVQNHDGGREAS